jgi:acetyl-CoA C-acetyltransferase
MSTDPRTPVIVGAAQVAPPDGAAEGPISLAARALRLAADDSGVGESLLRKADAAGHVATLCWPYSDEAALIARELGIGPRLTLRTAQFGGDGPGVLVSWAAQAIADGQLDVVLLSGAEAIATLRELQKEGLTPEWPGDEPGAGPTHVLGTDRPGSSDAELAVGLAAPLYVYALLETALRARAGADPEAHQRTIAQLWSRFSEVAAGNSYAAVRRRVDAADLLSASDGNRPVSAPYTKLLTANANVDRATGLIMCSAQAAADAGVARERWVFPLAAARGHDEWFISERAELAASPAIRAVGRAVLQHAGVTIDEVAHVDLYSCFPSAVELAAAELGLSVDSEERPLTVTGGLTFAGGPGNNYSSHAIATLVERLRADPDGIGLSTALGWYATKHAAVLLSGRPGERPFRALNAHVESPPARAASSDYSGEATVEAFTVPYARDGAPEAGIVTALAPDGTRALARTTDPDLVESLLAGDPLGLSARIDAGQLNATS